MTITTTTLTRAAALCAVAGGLLFIAVQIKHPTWKTRRLRPPQHGQLPAPYPQPHRGHPTAKISSMNGSHPAEVRRALGGRDGSGSR